MSVCSDDSFYSDDESGEVVQETVEDNQERWADLVEDNPSEEDQALFELLQEAVGVEVNSPAWEEALDALWGSVMVLADD